MSQCCFCNMNCFCAEISFAHNFTRFLNEENGQTAFPSPHTPTFSMTISNDNTSITIEASEPASTDCWKVPVFPWEYWGLCKGVWRAEIEPKVLGEGALHPAVYYQEAVILLPGRRGTSLSTSSPASASHMLMKWELCHNHDSSLSWWWIGTAGKMSCALLWHSSPFSANYQDVLPL